MSGNVPTSISLSALKRNQELFDFRVSNLYCDPEGKVVGAKLGHVPTGAPVFLFQTEAVPQVLMWVDTPATSNQGLAHALEHLVAGKGTKGRYSTLLKEMRLSASSAATFQDFNYYGFSSGSGFEGFFEQFHAWLEALYRPDFSDAEAEREFYHFGVVTDQASKKRALVEKGTVYDEMQPRQHVYEYYFGSNQQTLGEHNPFGFDSGGAPDEMRGVTPEQIRRFYHEHYRLGPTTGFIFAISPGENAGEFLKRVSNALRPYSESRSVSAPSLDVKAKYPIHSAKSTEVAIHRFPSTNDLDPSQVLFAWAPVEDSSMVDLKLLELLFHGLADGERSLLYRSLVDSKTRNLESGATDVGFRVFLANSPRFPIPQVEISGIPGKRISVELVEHLRGEVSRALKAIADYGDQSDSLVAFNKLIADEAWSEHRSEVVWTKSPPGFGISGSETAWKNHLERLEMDQGFIRSLSEEAAWRNVTERLGSRHNIWRDLIEKFHLLTVPYATASAPSRELLEDITKARQDRLEQKIKTLMKEYETDDPQAALSRFEADEAIKSREIDQVQMKVARPRFTEHPPLTSDDDIHYRQIRLAEVPVVASIFERPPTLDIGLSFDLSRIPARYYKLLPILPRCLDSLGLNEGGHVISYSELAGEIQKQAYDLSIKYPYDWRAKKAELTIRASASDTASFRATLDLIQKLMRSNFLDLANADRLRDIVARRISSDDQYTRQAESDWIYDPVMAFRNQANPLFLAVGSHFTQAHWNQRLRWLLHRPVSPEGIDNLSRFADGMLAKSSGLSRAEFSQKLDSVAATGLEGELIEYWRKNISAFSDSERTHGLQQLTLEVQHDLRTGPTTTIAELQELQRLILNRRALRVDLTLSQKAINELEPDLILFLKSIPVGPENGSTASDAHVGSAVVKFDKQYSDSHFPTFAGFVKPDETGGNVVFVSDFPDYSVVDRRSLVQVLSSNLFAGAGPDGFYMKTWEAGLAYSNGVVNDPDTGQLRYYADRSPDLPALIEFVNSMAHGATRLQDNGLVDYAFSRVFSFSRATLTPGQRGRLLATELRDGTTPEKIRRFSLAMLALRKQPGLSSELKRDAFDSICGVLLTEECRHQQDKSRTVFFFIGSDKTLTDVEKRLSIHDFRRIYPSDYWME
jgi:Zn-dependent M16 (insulinase) family peptidase